MVYPVSVQTCELAPAGVLGYTDMWAAEGGREEVPEAVDPIMEKVTFEQSGAGRGGRNRGCLKSGS